MIEEYGTIIELKERRVAVVQCVRNSACQHCPSSSACQLGEDHESMLVEAYNQVGGQLNDRVKLVTTTRNFLQSSFLLYIVPVLGLLVGALLGQAIGERADVPLDPSLLAALCGSGFLVTTFLAIRFVTRSWKKEAYMPRIVAIEYSSQPQSETC